MSRTAKTSKTTNLRHHSRSRTRRSRSRSRSLSHSRRAKYGVPKSRYRHRG
jgi:hypothetical protein